MIYGNTLRAPSSGRGSVAETWPMPSASTARRARPRPATCRERAIQPAPGPTRPAICGCSEELATTQPALWEASTICGDTVQAPGYGPGSPAQSGTTSAASTAPRGRPRPATCRELAIQPIPGLTRRAISGSSGGTVMTPPALRVPSTICGDTVQAPGYGPGSVAAMGTTPAGITAPRRPPRPPMCREHAMRPAPGLTRPATYGCSAALAMTQPALPAGSTICGNTVRAADSGPGSVAKTGPMLR